MSNNLAVKITVSARDMATDSFRRMELGVRGVMRSVTSLQGMFVGLGAGLALKQAVSIASSFEDLALSLETVTGSARNAQLSTAWIADFTSRTPYQLEQVSQAFRQLAAYGIDPTVYLKTLGDTSSAMSKELMQTVEMFADAATGEFERLKEYGVRASTEGDKVTFRWMQNGQQMTMTAKKTQGDITAALGQIFSRFDGDMAKREQAWSGMWSNMMDTLTMTTKQIMDWGPFQALKIGLRSFLDYLKSAQGQMDLGHWAAEAAEKVVSMFQAMTAAAGPFLAVLQAMRIGFHSIWVAVMGVMDAYSRLTHALPEWTGPLRMGDEEYSRVQDNLKKQYADSFAAINSALAWQDENGLFGTKTFEVFQKRLEEIKATMREGLAEAAPMQDLSSWRLFGSGSGGASGETAKEAAAREKAAAKALKERVSGIKAVIAEEKRLKGIRDAGAKQRADILDWTTELVAKNREAAQAAMEAGNDFGAGWAAGMAQVRQDMLSGFQIMRDMATQTAQAMGQAFSDFFYDLIWSETKSAAEYLTRFAQSVTRAFSSILGQQIAGGLAGSIGGLFGGSTLDYAGATTTSSGIKFITPGLDSMRGFDAGGWITEPVVGRGLRSGASYAIAENGPELVSNPRRGQVGGGTTVVQHFNMQVGVAEAVQREVRAVAPYIQAQTIRAIDERSQRGRRV